eukprot:4654895-Pyramimonas_sp.AAC.1
MEITRKGMRREFHGETKGTDTTLACSPMGDAQPRAWIRRKCERCDRLKLPGAFRGHRARHPRRAELANSVCVAVKRSNACVG